MTQKINNRQTFVLNKNNHRNENNNGVRGVKEGAFWQQISFGNFT